MQPKEAVQSAVQVGGQWDSWWQQAKLGRVKIIFSQYGAITAVNLAAMA